MNRKGPISVDPEPAALAASRRGLLRVAGAALVGAGAALLARPTLAAPPTAPNEADKALLEQAMLLELTAFELYRDLLVTSSMTAETAELVGILADNHQAFAQSIAGVAGLSASGRNDTVYESMSVDFAADALLAAHSLEQTAVSTHTELLGIYESLHPIDLTASILVIEARQATVIADAAGVTDLDVIFGNDQPPIDLAEVAV